MRVKAIVAPEEPSCAHYRDTAQLSLPLQPGNDDRLIDRMLQAHAPIVALMASTAHQVSSAY